MESIIQLLDPTSDGEYGCVRFLFGWANAYLRNAKGVEYEQKGEKEKIQAVSEQFNRFQMMNFNEHMHCLRGTHLKTQGVSARRGMIGGSMADHCSA